MRSYYPDGTIRLSDWYGDLSDPNAARDRLYYHYHNSYKHRGQLVRVGDLHGASVGPDDFGSQGDTSYLYYTNGQLKTAYADSIQQIFWNVANKIDRIVFSGASGKPDEIVFHYDAMGERIAKIVKDNDADPESWVYTYYVRDAQGNVMAVYDRQTFKPAEATEPPNFNVPDVTWSEVSSAEYLKLAEHHLYGSSRLGLYQSDRYLAIYASEFETLQNFPPWYSPFEPLPGDPCGCEECESPPCEPCWCVREDECRCPPCVGDGCDPCYCEEWPEAPEIEAPHAVGYFERGRKRYELTNHLSNVLAVVSDRKLQISDGHGNAFTYNPDRSLS